jgi:hypothetical protein
LLEDFGSLVEDIPRLHEKGKARTEARTEVGIMADDLRAIPRQIAPRSLIFPTSPETN